MNNALKKADYEEVSELIEDLDSVSAAFNSFKLDNLIGKVLQTQTGVYKVTCLDCLARTNKFMQCLALRCLERDLKELEINFEELSKPFKIGDLLGNSEKEKSILKNFRDSWNYKADYESLIVTGTRAATGKRSSALD